MPKLSIGLPVYNGEQFLQAALDCFLAQTFTDFELIICDNASTDRTPEICRAYSDRDARIRYVSNVKNLGAVANFNRVFELARAPLFKWAAHDDLYHDTYLATCVKTLDENPDVVLAHSNTAFIDEQGVAFPLDPKTGRYVDPKTGAHLSADSPSIGDSTVAVTRFRQVLARGRWGSHMFGVIRRQVLAQTGLLPNFAGGDRAMLAELALLGRFQSVQDRLFMKRFHVNVSWALNQKELKHFLSADAKSYSRRARQLKAFFSAPRGKPIGVASKLACVTVVAMHCVKIGLQVLARKEARNAAHGLVWRRDRSPQWTEDRCP
jgi:glycosyltransferase involved in cell wall biosynthesis